ncbi:MAG: isopeptide-forming domain-containing fimbrial protein, partial [Lachnospiraceae bacterium]|nr:isopeptide-forming domain-containing fimbrial protein [Lachnospiraceae bacterium]
MKNMKKLLALVIAVAMVLAMGVSVFAAEGKTITLKGAKAGHTYTLYQIFTGTVEEDGKTLTNIQWGADANATYKAAYTTAASAAKAIAQQNDARKTAQDLIANSYLGTGTPKAVTADGNVVFDNLAEGYYVIVDSITGTVAEEGDYSSAYIVQLVKDITPDVKGSGATSDKSVIDASNNKAEAAAYSIGDAVPFELSAKTADNVAAYRKYHITFQDKQSAGLDAPTSFTVTALGKTFTVPATGDDPAAQTTENGTKITVTKTTPDSGNTFAI